MRKAWKTLSLGMILVFTLMIFKPYSVLAEGGSKTPVKIPVNVQITAANKTYDPKISLDENFKTTVTSVKVVPENGKDAALVDKYKVNGSYEGEVKLDGPTIGDLPVKIDNSKLKITYTPNDDYEFTLNKVLPVSVKVFDDGASAPTVEEQKKQIENLKKAEDDLYSRLEIGKGTVPEFSYSGNKSIDGKAEGTIELNDYVWEVFSSARSGYTGVRSGFYDDWFKMIQNGLQKMKDNGITARDVKLTEWEKLILAITAIGYDVRDIKSYDLIEIVSNKANITASPEYLSFQYGILALTCNDYMESVPQDGNHISKADIQDHIHEWAANTIAKSKSKNDVVNTVSDLPLMQIQPIAAYYNPNAKEEDNYYDVKQAVEIIFDQFSNAQTYGGFFWGGHEYSNNAWTNAQVYMTLGMAKANIFDKKYIKCGKTVIDGVLDVIPEVKLGWYEPAQICRGVDSLIRAYEGRNSIFDCTDVKQSTIPVNDAISALPAIITSDNKTQVDAAQALYNTLSDAKKASLKESTKAKLAAAQDALNNVDKALKISNLTDKKEFKLGDNAKVSVKVENNSDKDREVSLIVGLYDGSNKFIKYVCSNKTIKKAQSAVLDGIIKLPEKGIHNLKAFVWDSLENMNPIFNAIDMPVK